MRKVLLIGPYPPPFGGLAVQLCQWQRYLAAKEEYQCEVLNIGEGRSTPIDGCLPVRNEWHFVRQVVGYSRRGYLLHVLTNGHNRKSWLSCLVCAAAGLLNGRRTILVLGSGDTARYLSQADVVDRLIARAAMKLAGHVICRNETVGNALVEMGTHPDRLSLMPGFLGADHSREQSLPVSVQEFMTDHDPVLGATASIDPEYGIPLMIKALAGLLMCFPKAGLVLMGPSREQVEQRYGPVPANILVTGGLPHAAVMATMQGLRIFLRPTLFDGDSISVREALALGVPVVASNVGLRPEGVTLFPVGELKGMSDSILNVLRGSIQVSYPQESLQTTTADQLLLLYDKLFMSDAGNDQEHVAAERI